MADVENPNPGGGVHAAKAEAGDQGIESLGLCAGALVAWTILAGVGVVVFFIPSVHAPKAVRVLASIGLAVAIVGFAAGMAWCGRILCPGNDGGLDR